MGISDLFNDALKYPLKNYKFLLVVGVMVILAGLSSIYSAWGGQPNSALSGIFGIIALIAGFIIGGYELSIVRETVNGSDDVPGFSWKSDFIMGIKYVILNIIYFIIPLIIVLIVAWATGLFDSAINIASSIDANAVANSTTNDMAFNMIVANAPTGAVESFTTSAIISSIVAIILGILFEFFFLAGQCRLAVTGSLAEGLKINKAAGDISEIGWGTFIAWFIIFIIIALILSAVTAILFAIPYVGVIIAPLLVGSYIVMFSGRALGLIYESR